jgi:hypothetical protein
MPDNMRVSGSLSHLQDILYLLRLSWAIPGQQVNFVNALDGRLNRFGLIEITDDDLGAHLLQRLGFRLVPHEGPYLNALTAQRRDQS